MSLLSSRDIAGMRGTLREVANATLTTVRSAGAPDRRGRAAAGTTLWAGSASGFLDRGETSGQDVVRGMGDMPAREEVRYTDTFTILDAEGAYVGEFAGPEWKGSRVTIRDDRTSTPETLTYRVVDMVHQAHDTLDSVVLILDRPGA